MAGKYKHADYMNYAVRADDRKKVIEKAVRRLRALIKDGCQFDTIAFTGMSGALIAPVIADRLGKPFTLVRKTTHDCHSFCVVEGWVEDGMTYIVIDDLVSTGETLNRIHDELCNVCRCPKLVGFYSYTHYRIMGRKEVERDYCPVLNSKKDWPTTP